MAKIFSICMYFHSSVIPAVPPWILIVLEWELLVCWKNTTTKNSLWIFYVWIWVQDLFLYLLRRCEDVQIDPMVMTAELCQCQRYQGILYLHKMRGVPVKTSRDRKRLPRVHLINCWGVKLFLLKLFKVLSEIIFSFVTLLVFEFCSILSFCYYFFFSSVAIGVLSQFELSLVIIWVFALSQSEFLSFVKIWGFEFCHYWSFWAVSQFKLSFLTFWVWVFFWKFFCDIFY